jgi:hypothetical protein
MNNPAKDSMGMYSQTSILDLYGTQDLGARPLFQGGYINFGY